MSDRKLSLIPRTSSLQKHFMCNDCDKVFVRKKSIARHFAKNTCTGRKSVSLKCVWCGHFFNNRGGLTNHTKYMHGINSLQQIYDQQTKIYKCDVCETSFCSHWALRKHIRKTHFNLQAKIPYYQLKKVNQVWFEKCLNSDRVIEIKKTGHSTLVMRRLDSNTAIKVKDLNTKTIDLSDIYPISASRKASVYVICDICGKSIVKKEFKKHYNEKHTDVRKFKCNNCGSNFKRSYQYLKHICNKKRRKKSYGFSHKQVEIINVTSLNVINVS